MALGKAWGFLKAVGDRPDDPPRQCSNCGQMMRSWISPEGRETEYNLCSDCYARYHKGGRRG